MHLYFMGICGTAMGHAALLMKELGHQVSGSDMNMYPPMSEVLAGSGMKVMRGFDAERLAALRPDKVIIGNTLSRGNPEVEWLLDQKEIDFVSLPQLFHEQLLGERMPVVITGTHGKTTTATITAFLLERLGADPGWLIGGVPVDLPRGAELGRGAPFVIEGDEYDSAFFDKRSKFIHYRPKIAVLNNLEFDHADIFRDLEDVQRSFRHFLRIIPSSGYALINGDDQNLEALLPADWTRVLRVGCGSGNDLRIVAFRDGEQGASFELHWKAVFWQRIDWPLHGLFNARNAAMAVLASTLAMGLKPGDTVDLSGLSDFSGVKRRQDVLHADALRVVIEDFAHHPTAVKAAIEALRAAYPRHKMMVCFEPRSNTSATAHFQKEFTDALQGADEVYLGAVYRAENMAPELRLDTAAMVRDLGQSVDYAECFAENTALFDALCRRVRGADAPCLLVFLTNGAFDAVPQKIVSWIAGGLRES